jgi:hypothetical protein
MPKSSPIRTLGWRWIDALVTPRPRFLINVLPSQAWSKPGAGVAQLRSVAFSS